MARLLRHRQTKGPDSARPHLNRRATPRLHPMIKSPLLPCQVRSQRRLCRSGHYSKIVVVLCSERGILDHDGSTGAVCKRFEKSSRVENFHNRSEPSCELTIRRSLFVPFALLLPVGKL